MRHSHLSAALVAGLIAFSIPAVAAGQQPSADSLLRRIDLLERRSANLEQRVRELEAVMNAQPQRAMPASTSAKWQDLQNWRQLRRGMKMDEVRRLLGEPLRVEAGYLTVWYWDFPGPSVRFVDDKLDGWSEPAQ